MGTAADKIQAIIAAAEPNLAGKTVTYDIGAQLAREKQFYSFIVDPFTGKGITTIQELNDLILKLDSSPDYNFGALLPSGSVNGGKIEHILQTKYGYNLKATSKTRFTETEQARVKAFLQDLADQALKALPTDKTLLANMEAATQERFLRDLVAAMDGISIKSGYMTIFMKASQAKMSTLNYQIYQRLNVDSFPKDIRVVDIVSNIAGRGKSIKRREGTQIFTSNGEKGGEVLQVIINPDLNSFSPAAFTAVYEFAKQQGLLDPREEVDDATVGTTSPMDVSPEKWRQDVFEAISNTLGGKYRNLLLQDEMGQYHALFEKYQIAEEIALGRSISVLRGFMGELRGILIMDALIPGQKGKLMGTAKVTLANSLASESAPVDMIVDVLNELGRPYGFQIKNTSELTSYSWGNQREKAGMTIPNFYIERLQQVLNQSETDFFGAYIYNQPIDDASQEYRNIYSGFQGKFASAFIPVYQKLALYIIRQSTEIKKGNDLLSGTAVNDFFMMNNKIVPASAFYKAMNEQNTSLIKSSFALQEATGGYYHYGDDPDKINYSSWAAQARIKYEIEVKYAALLTTAYNMS